MITVSVSESNPISQKSYDDVMEQLELSSLPCTCTCCGSLTWYGSYCRYIKADDTKVPLMVRRALCCSCGRSHAILLSSMVPYSQIPLDDQVSLIEAFEKGDSPMAILNGNPEIDERTPFRLIRLYLIFWRERLKTERILLRPLTALTRKCLSLFGKQFMQIKHTQNLFFSPPT